MAEIVLIQVQHDGVVYDVDTPVSKIKDLSLEQRKQLRDVGAIGEPNVHETVKSEIEAKDAEIEALKAELAKAKNTTGEKPPAEK